MNKQRIINQQLRNALFSTVRSEDCAKTKDEKGYRWVANSGELMPGFMFGIQLDIQSMSLERFELNPVILFSHDAEKPIGKGESFKQDGALLMDVFFDQVDTTSKNVKAKVDAGTLRGMSVGVSFGNCTDEDFKWDKEAKNVTIFNSELLESSICSIPRDAKALKQQYSLTFIDKVESENPENKKEADATTTDKPAEAEGDTTTEPAETDGVAKDAGEKETEETEGENMKMPEVKVKMTAEWDCEKCRKNVETIEQLHEARILERAEKDKLKND